MGALLAALVTVLLGNATNVINVSVGPPTATTPTTTSPLPATPTSAASATAVTPLTPVTPAYLMDLDWQKYRASRYVTVGLAVMGGEKFSKSISVNLCFGTETVLPLPSTGFTRMTGTIGYPDGEPPSATPSDVAVVEYRTDALTADNVDQNWIVLDQLEMSRSPRAFSLVFSPDTTALRLGATKSNCSTSSVWGDARVS